MFVDKKKKKKKKKKITKPFNYFSYEIVWQIFATFFGKPSLAGMVNFEIGHASSSFLLHKSVMM